MNNLKFRAWDEDNKEMIYEVGITPEGIPYSIPDYAEASDQFNYYPSCHKMQFTGLFDRSGKEIYIGDVVKLGNYDKPYEVMINDLMQTPVIDNETGQEDLFKVNKNCRVIGTIYDMSDFGF